ncbi:hypothetical protein DOTSEDRAFT_22560 [Dothistroma septosporum NZE10]|uniref:Major facilitator superfamily (MFS) profile domain-containing protein n=1 Tax=Dothistroma septosporum (strain NZE10 / CBS 128990) TaxID=675120 RepID=N1PSZ2_DOTSN|nr:hypothetical protein DOTSEDRAFT_22560 [Dothistroma septosporum NZE10]
MTYHAATIYEPKIGLSGFLSRILAVCNGTEHFHVIWIAVFTIEKLGRQSLMIFRAVAVSFSLTVFAIVTSIDGSSPGIVAAVFLFVFNTFVAVERLGVAWL